jgi:hypothetical protein
MMVCELPVGAVRGFLYAAFGAHVSPTNFRGAECG